MLMIPMLVFASVAFVTDMWSRKIPNWLNAAAATAGLGLGAWQGGWTSMLASALAGLVGFVLVWMLYLVKGVGAGDVKFFAALGCLIGMEGVVSVLLASILLSGPMGLVYLILRRSTRSDMTARFRIAAAGFAFRDVGLLKTAGGGSGSIRFPFMIVVLPAVAWWAIAGAELEVIA